jgi:hypothetical protein
MPSNLLKEAFMAAAPVLPPSAAPIPEAPPLSQGARIVDTFIAPSKTFTDLRRSASWWAPWLLISIFSLVFIFAIGKQVGFEQVSKNQVEQLQISSKIVGIFAYGSPVLILFYVLIETVVLWLTFKLVMGAETSFGQAYAISFYAGLPGIIGAILGTIALFAGVNPEGFDINNPVGTNLAYYLDPETTAKFVRGMASSLDLISIWSIVLVGIGFACTSKVKRSTAITVVAVWYLVYKLVTSGLASM